MRLFVSQAGVCLPASTVRWVSCGVSLVLAVTLLTGPPTAAVAAEADGAASAEAAPVKSRPDVVSAAITARAQGKRVEVEGLRTETDTTYANPDGTMTTEAHAGAIRYQDEKDVWHKIDLDLGEDQAGTVSPEATATDLTLAGGEKDASGKDGTDLARVVEPLDGDREAVVAMQAPGELGTPVLEANTATYEDVTPDADLFVRTTQEGFEQQLVLNSSAALEEYASEDGTVAWRIPVRTAGVTPRAEDDGSVSFVAADGTVVSHVVAPLAWDAQVDEKSGDPGSRAEVALSIEDTDTGTVLVVTPDQEWVKDADRQFPVTIDPSYAKGSFEVSADTYVSKQNPSTNFGSDPELRVGTYNGGTEVARSFLNIPITSVQGRDITSAQLRMYETHSYSCTAREFFVRAAETASGSTTWNNQPAASTQLYGSTNVAKGFSSACAASWVGVDITSLARVWADKPSNIDRGGIRLTASESDSYGWKKFASLNHSSGRAPYVSFTYNKAPNQAATPVSTSTARTVDGNYYVGSAKPVWSTAATDPEASNVKYAFEVRASTSSTSSVTSCTTTAVASGQKASCAGSTALTEGATYYVRARATDSRGLVGPWSANRTVRINAAQPSTPSITCSGFADKSWTEVPSSSSTTCTFGASSGYDVSWSINGKAQTSLLLSSGTVSKSGISVPASGFVKIVARVQSRAGLTSSDTIYSFGTGTSRLLSPAADERSTSTFPVLAQGPPGAGSAKLQWRFAPDAASSSSDWTEAEGVSRASSGDDWDGTVLSADGASATPKLLWDPQAEPGIGTKALVEVRVVFSYGGTIGEKPSPLQRVQTIPHAFGGSFPAETFGPGQAALYTGEFQLSETDVDVPGYGEPLTLGRSHLSFAGEPAGPAGVFGPGWKADLRGPSSGAGGFAVIDRMTVDGSIMLQDPEGATFVYRHSSGEKGEKTSGRYVGVGETSLGQGYLVLSIDGGIKRLTLTEKDDATTTFEKVGNVWTTREVVDTSAGLTTRYAHDGDGDVSWIFAPAPSGVTCSTSVLGRGCRALQLIYDGTGDSKRLVQIKLRLWNPTSSEMTSSVVAAYGYDSQRRLTEAWDPRISPALKTTYSYDTTSLPGRSLLRQVGEPGLKPWSLNYDDSGRVVKVLRDQDPGAGGGVAEWNIRYDLPVSAAGDGLPDLSATATAAWGQPAADAPSSGAAVFGPDRPLGGEAPTAADFEYADLSYTTDVGRTSNTASFGAGAWQIDSVRYDELGEPIWELSAQGRARAIAEGDVSAASKYAELTVYSEDGTRVEARFSPMTEMLVEGEQRVLRVVTETDYDDEVPSSLRAGYPSGTVPEGGFGLPVQVRESLTGRISPEDSDALFNERIQRFAYAAQVAGDGDGWKLRMPTVMTTAVGTPVESTILQRFDAEGKPTQTRSPEGSATNQESRWTDITYYTADASSPRVECRNRPEWAGQKCWNGPHVSASGAPSTLTTYGSLLKPDSVVETGSGGASRATTTKFDAAGRVTRSTVTTQGVSTGSVEPTDFSYSLTTGLPSATSRSNRTLATSYDSWGRVVGTSDGTGGSVSLVYGADGRVATLNDGKGTYSYTYNGTDALGRKERRGFVTGLDVGLPSGDDVFTGAYDEEGNLIRQTYPGGLVADSTFDSRGFSTGLNYSRGGMELAGFAVWRDRGGRIARSEGLNSAAEYAYDGRDRLARVKQTVGEDCLTREYSLSLDSNRTKLSEWGSGSDGSCQTATGASTTESSYDGADRMAGDTVDNLGRTTTLSGSHSSSDAGTNVSVEYYDNDMVKSLSQAMPDVGSGPGSKRQTFTLDPADRVDTLTTVDETGSNATTTTKRTLHYRDGSDSPAWVTAEKSVAGESGSVTSWQRNVVGLDGDLALVQPSQGPVTLQLANLHGDVAIVLERGVDDPASAHLYEEYGTPLTEPSDSYGWLGAKQRHSNGNVGNLTLMGARLYNPKTGRFLSRDSVEGGNDNPFIYPADPVNQRDLDGRICVLGMGNCKYDMHRKNGAVVHVKNMKKLNSKHNIWNPNLVSWAIYNASFAFKFYGNGRMRVPYYAVYRIRLNRTICSFRGCRWTGHYEILQVRINWFDGIRYHGNLVTMFCEHKTKCPDWVNKMKEYY